MTRVLRSVTSGVATSMELLRALWRGPHWWVVPMVVVLLPAAIVFVVLQFVPVVAPFVYTLF